MTEEKAKFNEEMTKLMMLKRASEGKTPEPIDVISNLIDIKKMTERTGFPTYTVLQQIVYLKLGYAKFGEAAKVLNDWAEIHMQCLIAYKRQQRKEAIEMVKRAYEGDQTSFSFGGEQAKQPKKRFWQRQPKGEESEFAEES